MDTDEAAEAEAAAKMASQRRAAEQDAIVVRGGAEAALIRTAARFWRFPASVTAQHLRDLIDAMAPPAVRTKDAPVGRICFSPAVWRWL